MESQVKGNFHAWFGGEGETRNGSIPYPTKNRSLVQIQVGATNETRKATLKKCGFFSYNAIYKICKG